MKSLPNNRTEITDSSQFDFFNPRTNEFTVCFRSFHPLNSSSISELVDEIVVHIGSVRCVFFRLARRLFPCRYGPGLDVELEHQSIVLAHIICKFYIKLTMWWRLKEYINLGTAIGDCLYSYQSFSISHPNCRSLLSSLCHHQALAQIMRRIMTIIKGGHSCLHRKTEIIK